MTIPNCESWETGKPFTGIPSKFIIVNEDGENIGTLADLLPMLLYAANNLQDLENPETARQNLGVYSKSEIENAINDAINDATPQATETLVGVAKIATTAIAQAGTNDTDFLTPLKLKQTVFGLNQSLLDVTASRVAGTTYTNTTPYPKIVMISNTAAISGYISLDTQNGEVCRTTRSTSGTMTAVIPKGDTYTLSPNAGTSFIWWEF